MFVGFLSKRPPICLLFADVRIDKGEWGFEIQQKFEVKCVSSEII